MIQKVPSRLDKYGPCGIAESITATTMHCREGDAEWQPLSSILEEIEPPAAPPLVLSVLPKTVVTTETQKPTSIAKVAGIGCLAIIGLFILLGIIGSIVSEGNRSPKNTASSGNYIEARRPISEIASIYTGPSEDYSMDKSGALFPEETLYVLEERNGWIRFRVTPSDIGWSGWIRKDQTTPK
jgi:hypothetical protein